MPRPKKSKPGLAGEDPAFSWSSAEGLITGTLGQAEGGWQGAWGFMFVLKDPGQAVCTPGNCHEAYMGMAFAMYDTIVSSAHVTLVGCRLKQSEPSCSWG